MRFRVVVLLAFVWVMGIAVNLDLSLFSSGDEMSSKHALSVSLREAQPQPASTTSVPPSTVSSTPTNTPDNALNTLNAELTHEAATATALKHQQETLTATVALPTPILSSTEEAKASETAEIIPVPGNETTNQRPDEGGIAWDAVAAIASAISAIAAAITIGVSVWQFGRVRKHETAIQNREDAGKIRADLREAIRDTQRLQDIIRSAAPSLMINAMTAILDELNLRLTDAHSAKDGVALLEKPEEVDDICKTGWYKAALVQEKDNLLSHLKQTSGALPGQFQIISKLVEHLSDKIDTTYSEAFFSAKLVAMSKPPDRDTLDNDRVLIPKFIPNVRRLLSLRIRQEFANNNQSAIEKQIQYIKELFTELHRLTDEEILKPWKEQGTQTELTARTKNLLENYKITENSLQNPPF